MFTPDVFALAEARAVWKTRALESGPDMDPSNAAIRARGYPRVEVPKKRDAIPPLYCERVVLRASVSTPEP